MSRNRNQAEGPSFGCIFMLILIAVGMPLMGLYYFAQGCMNKDSGEKAIGIFLLILGCIIWGWWMMNK